jgi:hypothetical protein
MFMLAPMKTLTYSNDCSESCVMFRLSLFLIGQFSPVYIHGHLKKNFWISQLSEHLLESQAAFRKSIQAS